MSVFERILSLTKQVFEMTESGNKMAEKRYDRNELANYLGCSRRSIERYDEQRKGPPRLMIAGRWLYPAQGVEDWLEAQIEIQRNAPEIAA